jgi:hypothetical protein
VGEFDGHEEEFWDSGGYCDGGFLSDCGAEGVGKEDEGVEWEVGF